MASGIFINYRRDDSAVHALAIAQHLEAAFGKNSVFLDIDRMRAGQSFPTVLRERLQASQVMLAVIGPQWLTLRNDDGQRRIDDSNDWVRQEIETALKFGLLVIPVLVGGGMLPRRDQLPTDLMPLVDHHAVTVTTNGFRNEMAGLVRDIRGTRDSRSWRLVGGVAAGSLLLLLGGWVATNQLEMPVWMPWQAQKKPGVNIEEQAAHSTKAPNPFDQFDRPQAKGETLPQKGRSHEIASHNLIDELLECTSFYSLVAEAVKSRADSATVTAGYNEAMVNTLMLAMKTAETINQKPEAVFAKFKMQQEAHLKAIDRNYSNMAILNQKLLSSCPSFTSNPVPRFQQLIAAAEAEVNNEGSARASIREDAITSCVARRLGVPPPPSGFRIDSSPGVSVSMMATHRDWCERALAK